jgi:hypothetical protein
MSDRGRPAAQPPAGWRPAPRRDAGRVRFISEDGRQHRMFDASTLPGTARVREDLVAAFEAATGPLGTWKRQASANGLWTIVRKASRWLAENRPGLTGLAQLSTADMRMLLLSMRLPNGDLPIGAARALFGYSPMISTEVRQELARHRSRNRQALRQPYPAEELRWITIAARRIVRRARTRLDTHWRLVQDFNEGHCDGDEQGDPRRLLAQALAHCARTGRLPASSLTAREVAAADGPCLPRLLHLTAGEAWAFAVLLAALTGLNGSVIYGLPAAHTRAGRPGEPGIALVNAVKPRRGPRSAMTLPLTAMPGELRPPPGDHRPATVRNTSLTTAFGVYTLLLALTEPARRQLGSDRAFVYCTGTAEAGGRITVTDGAPKTDPGRRRLWLREALTGEPARDEVLLGVSLNRLRRTYLEQHRRPVAHTPSTLASYLREMRMVTDEGFHIVREALDAQVQAALDRRQMSVSRRDDERDDTGQDTVLGSCADYQHSPLDDGAACRQTFLSCLDCSNARAFPRHLPAQLAVLDELRSRRAQVPLERWLTDFAGRVAQLEQIAGEFEPAQREQARRQITDTHRRFAGRLFSGDLDPL